MPALIHMMQSNALRALASLTKDESGVVIVGPPKEKPVHRTDLCTAFEQERENHEIATMTEVELSRFGSHGRKYDDFTEPSYDPFETYDPFEED